MHSLDAEFDPRFRFGWRGAGLPAEVEAIAAANGAACLPPLGHFTKSRRCSREVDLLLTPDTSVVHLAAAWKIPMVGLFPETRISYRGIRTLPLPRVHAATVPEIPVVAVEERCDRWWWNDFRAALQADAPPGRTLDQRDSTGAHVAVENSS